jgi:predicted metal-binding membrane protein
MQIATSSQPPQTGAPSARNSVSEQSALCGFVIVMTTLFVLSAAATIVSSVSMSALGTLPMPGGWSMALSWIASCGSSPLGASAQFVAMWLAMTATMMLPSLAVTLWRYGRGACTRAACRGRVIALTGAFAAAYFAPWAVLGALVHLGGTWLALSVLATPALARAMPYLAAGLVMSAGAIEGSTWKRHYLRCCRVVSRHAQTSTAGIPAAALDGLHFGWHCTCCCAAPTAVMLVAGSSDLYVVAAATLAITAERLAPCGERVARAFAILAWGAGAALLARALLAA